MSTEPKDGGSAFPVPAHHDRTVERYRPFEPGMSLRAWFAGQALVALSGDEGALHSALYEDWSTGEKTYSANHYPSGSHGAVKPIPNKVLRTSEQMTAAAACRLADAMIEALQNKES